MSKASNAAFELVQLQAQILPLEEKRDALKATVRDAGPDKYEFQGFGKVTVTEPSTRRAKGIEPVFDPVRYLDLDPALKAQLERSGVVVMQQIYIKSAPSKVLIEIAA
ncbi:hypothetical protein ACUN0C_18185 [Faunimonas sp. B44]|uniref:hypothetical protein n=1 Tax=Faunimonas sp. B44 TaxID=3461493 RepID=UPI004043E4BB